MREYFRYMMRSRDGLYAYLRFLLTTLGVLFGVHMFLFAILIRAKHFGGGDEYGTMLYELFGIDAGGVACVVMTERLLRVCVGSGVSRKSFLKGQLLMMPFFALVTSAVIMLVSAFTDGVCHLFKIQFNSLAAQLYYNIFNQYEPHVLAYNLTILFCIELLFYSFGLLIIGFRQRYNLVVGLIAAAVPASYIFTSLFDVPITLYRLSYPVRWIQCLHHNIRDWMEIERIAVTPESAVQPDHFWVWLLMLTAVAVAWYLICYGVFSLLTARVAVRGTECESCGTSAFGIMTALEPLRGKKQEG